MLKKYDSQWSETYAHPRTQYYNIMYDINVSQHSTRHTKTDH